MFSKTLTSAGSHECEIGFNGCNTILYHGQGDDDDESSSVRELQRERTDRDRFEYTANKI